MGNNVSQVPREMISGGFRLLVAIPLYNEESVLPELLKRLRSVLDEIPGGPHEILLVDDGSTDRTLSILELAAAGDSRIIVVSLSRNFGHQAALSAALDNVTGDAVVLMDGDLQDRPETIPLFIEKFNEGFDVVCARRIERKEAWWLRSCYYTFYRLLSSLSEIRLQFTPVTSDSCRVAWSNNSGECPNISVIFEGFAAGSAILKR